MRIKYLGEDIPLALTHGKTYDVLAVEKGPDLISDQEEANWLRIITDIGEDYLFQLTEGAEYQITNE